MVLVTRKTHFNAAHRLHNPSKSDEWNKATFGKCNHPNWHGHNYIMEVTVAGEPNPDTGFIIDLSGRSFFERNFTKFGEPCESILPRIKRRS